MPAEDELKKLEQSINNAADLIPGLRKERDHWKAMYNELSGQLSRPEDGELNTETDHFVQMENLVNENRLLRTKLQQAIHQAESLQNKIKGRLNL
jgi:FtsZ-binding cell division protein ZapB